MKYQVGRTGKVVVARFEDKEDVLSNLTDIAKKEDIKAAVVYLGGAVRNGRIVAGPEKDAMPTDNIWRELGESHEMLGVGTIFYQGDEPKVHLHGAFGKRDNVKVGCLREKAETFLLLEAVIVEIEGVNAVRELDHVSGLALLRL